ncbi:MAG: restriction endonuclease subunit S [Clostridia bacterium]|nr:restriction endonuclease subunit S [Clostridia bacterium]
MRAMKDSGIAWIGEIPAKWELRRLRYLCTIVTGNQDTQDNDPDGVYPFYVRSPIVERSNKYTFDGEAILMAGDGVGAGKVFHYVEGKYGCHQRVYSLQNIKNISRRFLFYYLQNRFYISIDIANSKSTVDSVRLNMLQDFPVVFPSKLEQDKISTFLDIECARIDAVIEQTRASIEEYKKLKQSVITKAVTKGIHPNRSMKDSGVDWIVTIPSDWQMIRGKGLFVETNVRSDDGSEELLTVSQYTGITPRSQKTVNMFEAETLEGYKVCEIGDIAANTMWLWAGAIGVSQYKGVISPSYNIYRQIGNAYVSKYLDYMLRVPPLVQHYESLSTGIRASRLRLYPEQFLGIRFPVPSIEEQRQIVDYLDAKAVEMDNLIEKKEELLAELESYKKALIYEYVTGKKEI